MRILASPLALVLLLVGCAGPGGQRVPMPPLEASVAGDRCRVFVAREDTVAGSIRNVRVFDGDTEIGVIDEQEFLCWERKPVRGYGRVVFEGIGLELAAVENLFDLPREPGTTGYYSIRIPHEGHKPEVTLLSSEAGLALIDSRSPATIR
jgi:hypothetical protein